MSLYVFFPDYILLWCEPCALGETVMVAVVDVPVVLAGRGFKTYDHRSAFLMGRCWKECGGSRCRNVTYNCCVGDTTQEIVSSIQNDEGQNTF